MQHEVSPRIGKSAIPLGIIRNAWQSLWIRYYFKFVLPKINSTEIDGIKLDLTSFSPKVRNRILMGYETAEKQICREFLSETDSIVELGGGIGFIGLFCQKRLGVKNYTTVEANPNTIELLKQNYRLNGVIPHVLNYAISRFSGTVELNVGGDFWEHTVASDSSSPTAISVPAITLSNIFEHIPFSPSALIIDVEGAEECIDFRKIPESIRKIIIETHPVIVGKAGVQKVIRALCERGFHMVRKEGDTMAFTKSH